MSQTTTFSTQSSLPFPDVFSTELAELFETARHGIVQVYVRQRGGGTGIVWSRDGRIVTNNHVIPRDESQVHVRFTDGRMLEAQVVSRNAVLDLALLKIVGDNFAALPIGDSSKLRIGEWVFAIGHPWGQRWTVTAGIVSSLSSARVSRDLTTTYIKSDVRLAPGNSGGPLLDADGNVVGINAMIAGGDQSISIPGNVVSDWLAHLPAPRNVSRNVLGIEIQTVELPSNIRQSVQPLRETGVLIVGTQARQAYHADLLVGDVLLDVADTPVQDTASLRHMLAHRALGGNVSMRILRGGSLVDLDVALLTLENAA